MGEGPRIPACIACAQVGAETRIYVREACASAGQPTTNTTIMGTVNMAHDHAHDHGHDHDDMRTSKHPAVGPRGRAEPRNWQDRAAGGAAYPRSSPSVCGPARARSSCWCLRWRKACTGSASPRPSSWGLAPPSRLPPSPPSPSAPGARPSALPRPAPGYGTLALARHRSRRRRPGDGVRRVAPRRLYGERADGDVLIAAQKVR